MLEQVLTFTPSNGSSSRQITLRISDVRAEEDGTWSARADILGFTTPDTARTRGVDWAQAVELAAEYLPVVLEGMVAGAGGGTLDPPIYPRTEKGLGKAASRRPRRKP
jgi:hypothetical protein